MPNVQRRLRRMEVLFIIRHVPPTITASAGATLYNDVSRVCARACASRIEECNPVKFIGQTSGLNGKRGLDGRWSILEGDADRSVCQRRRGSRSHIHMQSARAVQLCVTPTRRTNGVQAMSAVCIHRRRTDTDMVRHQRHFHPCRHADLLSRSFVQLLFTQPHRLGTHRKRQKNIAASRQPDRPVSFSREQGDAPPAKKWSARAFGDAPPPEACPVSRVRPAA